MARRGPGLGAAAAPSWARRWGGGGADTRSAARDEDHLVLKTFGPLSYLSVKFVLGGAVRRCTRSGAEGFGRVS